MAVIVDEELARESPCTCYILDARKGEVPENMMCFSKGMLGALSDEQDIEYCKRRETKPASPALKRNIRNFRLMGEIMKECLGTSKTEKGFLSCVEMKAKKMRG